MRLLAALIAGLALGACGSADVIREEADAQKDKVETIIRDPAGAADQALENELRQRGVDGSTPPLVP